MIFDFFYVWDTVITKSNIMVHTERLYMTQVRIYSPSKDTDCHYINTMCRFHRSSRTTPDRRSPWGTHAPRPATAETGLGCRPAWTRHHRLRNSSRSTHWVSFPLSVSVSVSACAILPSPGGPRLYSRSCRPRRVQSRGCSRLPSSAAAACGPRGPPLRRTRCPSKWASACLSPAAGLAWSLFGRGQKKKKIKQGGMSVLATVP